MNCFEFLYRISLNSLVKLVQYEFLVQGEQMYLKVGDRAPDFVLESHLEKEHRLSDYRGKIVVLAFFPLAWTPV